MARTDEIAVKEARISAALARLGFDTLILTRRVNFAWITAGGRAITCYGEPDSPVYLVLTPRCKWAVGYGIDLPRTVDEELAGLGYEPVSLPSFGKTMPEAVAELTVGRVAADGPFPGAQDISAEIGKLYEPLLPEEMARYTEAAQTSGRIIGEIACWVQPGMTERQVMAEIWKRSIEAGHEGRYMFLGSDDRIRKYRHAVFTDKPIERCVLLAPCTARWGLDVPVSRLIYFGEPPADIRHRFLAVATMQAAMLATVRPGVPLSAAARDLPGIVRPLRLPGRKKRTLPRRPHRLRRQRLAAPPGPERDCPGQHGLHLLFHHRRRQERGADAGGCESDLAGIRHPALANAGDRIRRPTAGRARYSSPLRLYD